MAESVIFMAWAKLRRFLDEKAKFTRIVKSLRDDLYMLMGLLDYSGLCDKKLEEGSTQHYMISQAKEIAHYADIAIDTFISHVEISKGKGLDELREEIGSIQSWMRQVINQVKEVKDQVKFESKERRTPQRLHSIGEADSVGLEEDVKLLLNEAIFRRRRTWLSTMCIVGMGGIGKTTLASVLYNHADVAAHFELRAWVHVSSECDEKEVLWDLIEQVGMKDMPEMTSDEYELRGMIYHHLRGRKYFIVLDDVWRKSSLTINLSSIFPPLVSCLKMMINLRKLGIEEMDGKSDARKLFASLAKLQNLEHLILRGFRFRIMPELQNLDILHGVKQLKLNGLLIRLPSADNFPPNIECLSLLNSCLDEDPMPTLEKLSKLKFLKLRNAYSCKKMVISRHGFAGLHSLCIEELWHLRSVQVEEGAMKQLKKLESRNCPYLETLPKEIGSMKDLEELKMVTTRNIATMIRKLSFISGILKVDIQP